MTVQHQDFYEFAEKLALSNNEIDWRMSAGRTYYASFHRARQSTCHCPDNAHVAMGSHERVTDRFLLEGSLPAKSIAYVLQTMKKLRKAADYEITGTFQQSNAVNQLAHHRMLLQKLDAFDQSAQQKSA